MLAAFEASLEQGRIDVEVSTNSITDSTVGSNMYCGSLTGSEPHGLLNSTNMLPDRCYSRCETTSSDVSSHTDPVVESDQHQKVPNVNHFHVQNLSDSLDCVANERPIAEVESAHSNPVNAGHPPTADRASSSAASVQRKSAGRLSEKIKQTLQQNAKVDTPKRLNRLSALIQKYDTQAADITDVGPFYGLPVKVKHLLETQRSITEFYCKFLPFSVVGQ